MAVNSVLTARKFYLEYSYNKPSEMIHISHCESIKEDDY